nr:hypothetical protein [Thomasclavelia ramosa]
MNSSIALMLLRVLATSHGATVCGTSTKICMWSGITTSALILYP